MKENNYIDRIIGGDRKAFESLYRSFKPQFMAKFIHEQSMSREDAEDLYHDACIVLCNNIETGRLTALEDNQIRQYLNKTGRFVLFNKRRKRQIPLTVDSDVLARFGSEESTTSPDIEDIPYDKEHDDTLFVVRTAVRDMPEPCATLLNLTVYQKKSHREVAQIMHYSSEDTVKTQRYRCMGKLKETVRKRLKIAGYEE